MAKHDQSQQTGKGQAIGANPTGADFRLHGKNITLRPANPGDREKIYHWLAHSDLTPGMLGAPDFPDNPVPDWDEFTRDYKPSFFDGSKPLDGRCFIIMLQEAEIGQINHDQIYNDNSTELDIWLSDSRYTGKGYGSDALSTLCIYLYTEFHCRRFYIAPSSRNTRAVHAYRKAGFLPTSSIPGWFVPDYSDTVLMLKEIPLRI